MHNEITTTSASIVTIQIKFEIETKQLIEIDNDLERIWQQFRVTVLFDPTSDLFAKTVYLSVQLVWRGFIEREHRF